MREVEGVKPLVLDVDGKLKSHSEGDTWGAFVLHENLSYTIPVLQWSLLKNNINDFINAYSKITLNLTASITGLCPKSYDSKTYELSSKEVIKLNEVVVKDIISVYEPKIFYSGGVQAFVKVRICSDNQFIYLQVHTAAGGGGNSWWGNFEYADINISSVIFSS